MYFLVLTMIGICHSPNSTSLCAPTVEVQQVGPFKTLSDCLRGGNQWIEQMRTQEHLRIRALCMFSGT